MNIKQLKSFLAVADTGSVTSTAELLHLTQSGVSRQIASLEDEVGFALFDRVRGRLVINRKGQAFRRHVRQSVESHDHLPRAARAIAEGVFDRVSVVATSSIIHGLLPGSIAKYVENRPGLPPRVIMRSLREIADLGPKQNYDLILAPMPVPLSRFRLAETIEFELRVAGPAGLLPPGDGPVKLESLEGLPFISLDPFATYQESIETALFEFGIQVPYVCETSSVVTAAQLVRLGVGCAFLDPFIAGSIQTEETHVRQVLPGISHTYGIYAPEADPLSPEAGELLQAIRDEAGDK